MNSLDWLSVSNYVLAVVALGIAVEIFLTSRRTAKRLSEVERKLNLVLGYELEADHAWPAPEERGAETAPRDEFWRPGTEPADRP